MISKLVFLCLWCLLRLVALGQPALSEDLYDDHAINLRKFAIWVMHIKPAYDALLVVILESKMIFTGEWEPLLDVFEINFTD